LRGDTNLKWVDLVISRSEPQDRGYLKANVRQADFSDGYEYLMALKKTVDEVLLPAARKELREQVGKPEDDLLRSLEVMPPEAIEAELELVDKIGIRHHQPDLAATVVLAGAEAQCPLDGLP
jgi:hypothetical protein